MRNPAHPQALVTDEVQPGVTFLCYHKGELMSSGRFTSVAKNGKFRYIPFVDGNELSEKEVYLTDFGIVQRVGENGPFWAASYCVAY